MPPLMAGLTVFSTIGVRSAAEPLFAQFDKGSHKLTVTWGTAPMLVKRIEDGDSADVVVLSRAGIEALQKLGKLAAGSDVTLASSGVGIAVKAGAPKPDISTPDALKRTLLSAKSISYSDPSGGSAAGTSFADTLKALGIAQQVQSKAKMGKGGGEAMASVTKGEAEIGFVFYNEINEPGVDVVGPLPAQVSPPIRLVGLISSHAKNPAGAKALADFLSSPEAAAVYKAHRIIPGS